MNFAADLLERAPVPSEKTAFVFRGSQLTRGQLRERVLAVASSLHARGIRPGDRVALRLPNSPDFVVAWLAVQWLGAVAVQLPPVYRRRETDRIMVDSGASAILSSERFSHETVAAASRELPPHPQGEDDPATLTYVATIEGPLRGVIQTHGDISAAYDAYARGVLALQSDDVCIGALGLGFAYGFGALLAFPMLAGATAVVIDEADALLASIGQNAATLLFAVPTTYRMLLRHPQFDRHALRSLRCCVSAGEPLPASVVDEWKERAGVEILDGLGTTELTHIVVSTRPGAARPGFLGQPVGGYEARIVDEEWQDLGHERPGPLAVRGPTRARYWRDPDAERRMCRDGWTMTGDVCVRHEGDWFQHIRRVDALIVSAGYKISIREVESALLDHPEVAAARVEGRPDAIRGAVAHAVVRPEPHADRATLAERLRTYLRTELAPFKCPRVIDLE